MLNLLSMLLLVSTAAVIAFTGPDGQEVLQVNAGFIRLYPELDFNGQALDHLPIDDSCHPLEVAIKSAVTYGACIEFYPNKDCTGYKTRILPANGFYFRDMTVRGELDEGAKSYKGCRKPEDPFDDEIELFDDDDLSGESEIIKTKGDECHDLEKMRNKVSSVENHETCVELFQGPKCEGVSLKLFPGTWVPQSLTGVMFTGTNQVADNNIRSVKRCTVTPEELVPPPSSSVIKVYPQTGNQGEAKEVDLSPDASCKSLDGAKAAGLNTSGNCVQLFENEDCSGSSLKVFPGAEFPHEILALQQLVPSGARASSAKSLMKCRVP